MSRMEQPVVLIPAFEPDERLVNLMEQLAKLGLKRLVIVDDGSGAAYAELFEQIKKITSEKQLLDNRCSVEGTMFCTCYVLHHDRNKGKGAALKTGLAFIDGAFPIFLES